MVTSIALPTRQLVPQQPCNLLPLHFLCKFAALLATLFFFLVVIHAQDLGVTQDSDKVDVINGTTDTTAYSLGRSLKITGTLQNGAGAIALGGDVIVQGRIEGDVAAIGGSVIQLDGSHIGGDVIVVGGAYRHGTQPPNRNSSSTTIMYVGYEQELRNLLRNPTEMVTPHWSAAYVGLRILAILFWFVVSLVLTAARPGSLSHGIARLQLTTFRVAIIGCVGAGIIGAGVPFSLHYLPTALSALIGLLAILLIV